MEAVKAERLAEDIHQHLGVYQPKVIKQEKINEQMI
jgi:hypothetical protein